MQLQTLSPSETCSVPHITLSLSYRLAYVSHMLPIVSLHGAQRQFTTSSLSPPSHVLFFSLSSLPILQHATRYHKSKWIAGFTIAPVLCGFYSVVGALALSALSFFKLRCPPCKCAWGNGALLSAHTTITTAVQSTKRTENGEFELDFRFWVCGGKTAIYISIRTRTTELFAGFVRSVF